jgi:3-oxoacyl-[acyl-carrier-protein] synthase-1
MRVVAVGMSSSLGPAATACAAFRAGIVRARPSESVTTFAPGDSAPQPVFVREVLTSTFGFSGEGRLVAIAMEALEDLRTQVPLESLGREAGVFLALPDFSDGSGPEALAAAAGRLGRRVLGRALEALGVDWPEARWRFFSGGSAGFALALEAAHQALERRDFETCLVGGVDSLVEPEHLRYLLEERRLKTADNPVGLIPGEAGALLLLRSGRNSGEPETAFGVDLSSVQLGREPHSRSSNRRPDGVVLSAVMRAALGSGPAPEGEVLFIADLNGEEVRAWEWGCALMRLKSDGTPGGDASYWVPAVGFGDVGAAAGAVGAVLARHAFLRRYSPARRIVVVSQSDSGERSAFIVSSSSSPRAGGRT